MSIHQPHALTVFVRQLAACSPLDAAERQLILALPYQLRSLDRLAFISREGERPRHCAVIIRGFAFRHRATGGGGRQILSINIPGDALHLQNLFLPENDHDLQTLDHAVIAEIPKAALEPLALGNGGIARALLVSNLVDASILREWTVNIGRRDARTRIAHLICEFAYRRSAFAPTALRECELPMTQEQLADATGLTPVHVNRTLKTLEQDGLLVRDRRLLRFPDLKRLCAAADFSPRYLHPAEEQRMLDAYLC